VSNLGFISTRFAGTDGVSLESAKWAKVLWDHRHVSYWYAGKLDRDPAISMLVPEAYFYDRDNVWINEQVFGKRQRPPEVTRRILEVAAHLRDTIDEFVRQFEVDFLLVENALCLPMHIPLGVALTHYIAETGIPTIAHHHDFYWERPRFAVNAVGDFLAMAFPPTLPSIQHVTINSFAQEDLAWRKGAPSILVPNVLDFENALPPPESSDFRERIGLEPDDVMLLQPTRVVPRKGIEHSIALVSQLKNPKCKLVVSHESGDEGLEYRDALVELAEQSGVDLRFVHAQVRTADMNSNGNGGAVLNLAEVYAQADLITYPSLYEGFGNALLEAFYFREPLRHLHHRHRAQGLSGDHHGRFPHPPGDRARPQGDRRPRLPRGNGRSQLRAGQEVLQLLGAAAPAPIADYRVYGVGRPLNCPLPL